MAITKRFRTSEGKKSTYYQAEVYVKGVRVASQSFDTKALAYRWHDTTKDTFETLSIRPRYKDLILTFDQCLKAYIDSTTFKDMRKSSQKVRLDQFRHMEDCPLSKLRVADLTKEDIHDWLFWLRSQDTAKHPRRQSFDKNLAALKVLLSWYRNEVNESFVVPIVKSHVIKARYKQVQKRRDDYYIRQGDISDWLEILQETELPVIARLATFTMLTGLRISESAGLKWDTVDLREGYATIVGMANWTNEDIEDDTLPTAKTADTLRRIRLSPALVDMLSDMHEVRTSSVVFGDELGEVLPYDRIRLAFNRCFKRAKLPWTGTHILRHTFATFTLDASHSDIGIVQLAMGHKNRKSTEKYAKALGAKVSPVVDRAAEIMLSEHHVKIT